MKNLILASALLLPLLLGAQTPKEILYVGTYSIRESKGIYVFELNRAKGTLELVQTIEDLASPSYMEIHPSGKFLIAVNRGAIDGSNTSGSVSSYAIDPESGKLTFINHASSFGREPCHITIDKSGEWAFISNYNEGNFIVLPIFEDGSVGAPTDSKKYSGSSVNRLRQEQPHVHSAQISADNKYVYVSDLGTDKIYQYIIDTKNGRINPSVKPEVNVAPGAGPRHFAIHPNGDYAYSAEELSSTVAVFAIDKTTGALNLLQDTVRSLPKDIREINTSADIHTDPNGKFLYMSNRGADVISSFLINPDGKISFKSVIKTQGKTPRNFLVDNKGKFLWVANQNSDNLVTFRINPKTGDLTYTGEQIKIPSPVCIKQLQLK